MLYGSSNCGSCRVRRDGTPTFVYIWTARSPWQPRQRTSQSRPLLAGCTVAARPPGSGSLRSPHIVNCMHLHSTRSYDLVLGS
jgi:hypothetical protein